MPALKICITPDCGAGVEAHNSDRCRLCHQQEKREDGRRCKVCDRPGTGDDGFCMECWETELSLNSTDRRYRE